MNINKIKNENILYNTYNKDINDYFRRYKLKYGEHEIYEMSHDVFIVLNNNFNKLIVEKNNVRKWIFRTCRHVRIDYDRKLVIEDKKKFEINNQLLYTKDDILTDELDQLDFDTSFTNIDAILKKIIYHKSIGFNNKEICKILNISERNLYRKIDKLKKNVKI
jgi:DNA-directed RNA polymerase specialized sigma24 family protein